jgi:hypothetical protein
MLFAECGGDARRESRQIGPRLWFSNRFSRRHMRAACVSLLRTRRDRKRHRDAHDQQENPTRKPLAAHQAHA